MVITVAVSGVIIVTVGLKWLIAELAVVLVDILLGALGLGRHVVLFELVYLLHDGRVQ